MLNEQLTPREFCVWLKGFLSACGEGTAIPVTQANILKQKLNDVFDHSASPQFTALSYESILPPIQQTVAKGEMLPDHLNPNVHYPDDGSRPRC